MSCLAQVVKIVSTPRADARNQTPAAILNLHTVLCDKWKARAVNFCQGRPAPPPLLEPAFATMLRASGKVAAVS